MVPPQPVTLYSNVANVKTTGSELIFEFGAVFPDINQQAPVPGKPIQFNPEVRIIMALSVIKTLITVLQQAVAQVEAASRVPPPEPRVIKQ